MKISQLKSKKLISISVFIILILVITPLSVYSYNSRNYNKFITLGNTLLDSDEFDQAIENYNTALKYRRRNEKIINDKINLSKQLKESYQNYTEALSLFNENRYLEASDIFKKIPELDLKYYNIAKNKIDECISLYITDNLNKAKSDAETNKYDSAMAFLDNILKIDNTNNEALSLKNTYEIEIQNRNNSLLLASNSNNTASNSSNINDVVVNNSQTQQVKSNSNNTPPANTQQNVYPIIVRNPGPHVDTLYTGNKLPPDIDIPYKSLFHENNLGYMTVTVGRYPTWINEVFESWDLEIFLFDGQLFFKRKDHNMSPIYPCTFYVTVKKRDTEEILFQYIPE
ncbi:tetratricopeptide repeat protein [Clostridium intestinale]|uniref:Uncharacterized protein n=1 Tax=Clostridium intestinale DSM 6191 TaxID=1121320 RepID=A0A1M5V1Q3_9CLOT|nr:hypothetical protein [Clostridium intestinale]SHH69139.1 hypothetical protein SAMN02745941_00729 [Clostridium intestinale DSM 6191]